MAQSKADFYANNENRGHVNLLPSKSVDDAGRKHTFKKQAFGELKNVIHNQCPPKASKPADIPIKNPNKLKNEVGGGVRKLAKIMAPSSSLQDNDIEMLNYFDYGPICCQKPHKSDRQIWSEMNPFEDNLLDNIIQGVFMKDDDKQDEDDYIELDKSESEDILDINNSKLFPSVFAENDEDSLDEICLPAIQMEKFDFF